MNSGRAAEATAIASSPAGVAQGDLYRSDASGEQRLAQRADGEQIVGGDWGGGSSDDVLLGGVERLEFFRGGQAFPVAGYLAHGGAEPVAPAQAVHRGVAVDRGSIEISTQRWPGRVGGAAAASVRP